MVLDEEDEDEGEDEDDEELALSSDNDIREIFDELRGNKPLMVVQDLYDWADIQDMLAAGDIDERQGDVFQPQQATVVAKGRNFGACAEALLREAGLRSGCFAGAGGAPWADLP
jgi:hypothetical protein